MNKLLFNYQFDRTVFILSTMFIRAKLIFKVVKVVRLDETIRRDGGVVIIDELLLLDQWVLETLLILTSLIDEKVSRVLRSKNCLCRVLNVLMNRAIIMHIPLENVLLGMPLNSINGVVTVLHGSNKLLTLLIIIDRDKAEVLGKIIVERSHINTIVMVVHGNLEVRVRVDTHKSWGSHLVETRLVSLISKNKRVANVPRIISIKEAVLVVISEEPESRIKIFCWDKNIQLSY